MAEKKIKRQDDTKHHSGSHRGVDSKNKRSGVFGKAALLEPPILRQSVSKSGLGNDLWIQQTHRDTAQGSAGDKKRTVFGRGKK